MWGLHLKRKGRWWHYYRAVPREFHDVEPKRLISFSLKTGDFIEAKRKASEISANLEADWRKARARGCSLNSEASIERYKAAAETQKAFGFEAMASDKMNDRELLERLRFLLENCTAPSDQRAVLGLVQSPDTSLSEAFDRFWSYIQDEWSVLSHDQQRVKRNVYLKSIRNFETAVGAIPFNELERRHAIAFRAWWMERIKKEKLKPYTANREINSLRRLVRVNQEIDGVSSPNPFSGIRLKDTEEVSRVPLERAQIEALLREGLEGLAADWADLFRLLVNTGMRPVEAIGLLPEEFHLDAEIPHVHVRKNVVRGLKTAHSERLLPLCGVSLQAARSIKVRGGWGNHLGKNMLATGVINKHLRASGLMPDKRQSLYSLRHWFQDQLTKRDVVDRAQAQLMGHKFQRPKYGYGKDLAELREIISSFAISAP